MNKNKKIEILIESIKILRGNCCLINLLTDFHYEPSQFQFITPKEKNTEIYVRGNFTSDDILHLSKNIDFFLQNMLELIEELIKSGKIYYNYTGLNVISVDKNIFTNKLIISKQTQELYEKYSHGLLELI